MRVFLNGWIVRGIVSAAFAFPGANAAGSGGAYAGDLSARNIGPGFPSGRISEIAVHPERSHEYLVAAGSGGVWRTRDNGTTWSPIFEAEGSFSVASVVYHPGSPSTIWVATGENVSARHVGYGDGLYRSDDSGETWRRVGLQNSEHIGNIAFRAGDPETMFAAAHGPLRRSGGQRGVFRSTDGGETWEAILEIDDHTGANEVIAHAQDPSLVLASTFQRQYKPWAYVGGGPGSGIYLSEDGGDTWRESTAGLPTEDLGKIGLGVSKSDPNRVYAVIEARGDGRGFYRSDDFGRTWTKQSDKVASAPFYYNEIIVDPKNADRAFLLDMITWASADAGKTWSRIPFVAKHEDDHALWIDETNPNHMRVGSDGGIYETYNSGQTWRHIENLPITQVYGLDIDQGATFYEVFYGTQDNYTLHTPSRTTSIHGVTNPDTKVVFRSDGFKPSVDPFDSRYVYVVAPYGNIARFDRDARERLILTPFLNLGLAPLRWNWSTPILARRHREGEVLLGANIVLRSRDRGSSWEAMSPDLTRGGDKFGRPMMGREYGPNEIGRAYQPYGTTTAIAESPIDEDLIFVGTDDGLVQMTRDGGKSWTVISDDAQFPRFAGVTDIEASPMSRNQVFATLSNHMQGDFRPYLYVSDNLGRTWKSLSEALPRRGHLHTIAQDHVDEDLLFLGSEFGAHVSQDGGANWAKLDATMPTIPVRDIELHEKNADAVLATFGRGIYVFDDYSALRDQKSDRNVQLFQPRTAHLFAPGYPQGVNQRRGARGHQFYSADDPPYGALITYRITADELSDTTDAVWLSISSGYGDEICKLEGLVLPGYHRLTWNLRMPLLTAEDNRCSEDGGEKTEPWQPEKVGPFVRPGRYAAQLFSDSGRPLSSKVAFEVVALNEDENIDSAFLLRLQTARAEANRLAALFSKYSSADLSEEDRIHETIVKAHQTALFGDKAAEHRSDSIIVRLLWMYVNYWNSTAAPTIAHRDALSAIEEELESMTSFAEKVAATLKGGDR